MERKTHWAWPAFTAGLVPRDKLHIHLEHEWAVYVRDFPIMVGRAYVQCPIAEVRRELAENLYEEETGGLAAGRPHPELFMMYPRGLGMDVERFANVQLLPAARAYRGFLDDVTTDRGWAIAAAISTLFIEGTAYERHELDASAPPRPQPRARRTSARETLRASRRVPGADQGTPLGRRRAPQSRMAGDAQPPPRERPRRRRPCDGRGCRRVARLSRRRGRGLRHYQRRASANRLGASSEPCPSRSAEAPR